MTNEMRLELELLGKNLAHVEEGIRNWSLQKSTVDKMLERLQERRQDIIVRINKLGGKV